MEAGFGSKVPIHAKFLIEKYASDEDFKEKTAYDISEFKDNKFLVEGINELWKLACSTLSPTAYDTANARVGVGDSTVTEDETQTALQSSTATSLVAMDTGYPDVATSKTAKFRGTFDGDTANFSWQEFTVDNGNTANKNLNRKVSNQGTKTSGQTWVLTIELSIVNP